LPIAISLFQGQHLTDWGLVFGDGHHASTLAAVAAGLSGEATLLGEPDHQRVARTSGNICWRGSCAAACCAPTFPDLPELERGPWS
jgi:hypothetical protein